MNKDNNSTQVNEDEFQAVYHTKSGEIVNKSEIRTKEDSNSSTTDKALEIADIILTDGAVKKIKEDSNSSTADKTLEIADIILTGGAVHRGIKLWKKFNGNKR